MIEEQLGKFKAFVLPSVDGMDAEGIRAICKAVGKWLRQADEQGQTLVLEAMQIEVRATR